MIIGITAYVKVHVFVNTYRWSRKGNCASQGIVFISKTCALYHIEVTTIVITRRIILIILNCIITAICCDSERTTIRQIDSGNSITRGNLFRCKVYQSRFPLLILIVFKL